MDDSSEALLATEAGQGPAVQIAPPQEVRRGGTIGRYVVVDRVGAGGMGVVYAAYDPDLDRKVALKLLHRDQRGGDDSPASQRLLREAQAMAKLDHPNVATVHDVGTFDGTVFLAMEFISGQTLRGWLAQPRTPAEILATLVQAGRGLAAAHAQGLVHRDFKPDNVMVADSDGRVRVMDFGLVRATHSSNDAAGPYEDEPTVRSVGASLEPDPLGLTPAADDAMDRVRARMAQAGKLRAVDPEPTPRHSSAQTRQSGPAAGLTRTGAMIGTPAYMSPEQVQGQVVGEASDQFSFAITAWEALMGERPFGGKSVAAITAAIAEGKLRPAHAVPGLPRTVVPALTRALSVESVDRFESMNALLAVLDRAPGVQPQVWIAGAAVVATIAAVGAVALDRSGEGPCQGAVPRIDAAWKQGPSQAVSAALRKTGVSHAAVTAEKVVGALDRYTTDWAAAHTDACEATRVREEQSEALLDLRMACLDTRLAEFEALVAILRDADVDVASRATEAATRLPSLGPCADRTALTRTVDPPPDDATQARIATVRKAIGASRAAAQTGRYVPARALADGAVADAQAIGYRPLRAEAFVQLGVVLATLGETDPAIARLEDGALEARASGHLEVAASAEAWLTFVVGHGAGRAADGLAWSRQAQAEIDRLGGEQPVRAEVLNHRAVLLQLTGDSAAALTEFAEALQLRRRLLGEAHPDTAESRFNLAVYYRRTGEYERSWDEHQRALEIRRAFFGPEHPKVAESLLGMAGVAERRRDSQLALTLTEQALALQSDAFGKDHVTPARTHEALAILASEARDFDAADEHFRVALSVYQRRLSDDDPRIGQTLKNLGNMELLAKRYDAAREHLQAAMEHYERIYGPTHPDVGRALAGYGRACLDSGDHPGATAAFTRSVAILDASLAEPLERGTTHASLAEALWPADPAGSKEAAGAARRLLVQAGPPAAKHLAELDAFTAEHFGTATPPE